MYDFGDASLFEVHRWKLQLHKGECRAHDSVEAMLLQHNTYCSLSKQCKCPPTTSRKD